jgi:hypothetical protein
VQQHRLDAADGVFGFGLVARPNDDAVAAAPDVRPLGNDVKGGAVAVGREEADGVAFRLTLLTNLFGQTNGGEGTAGAEAVVFGDGRPFDRFTEPAGVGESLQEVGAGGVVDGDADGDIGGMVADTAFGNGLTKGFFEENGIGDDLEPIGGPGGGGVVVAASGLAAFVFIGEIGAVAATEAIDLTGQTEGGAGQLDGEGFAIFFIGFEGGVKLTAGEDGGVGDADFFDFFEVEETTAIGQGVQGHDPDHRAMRIEDGERGHGWTS